MNSPAKHSKYFKANISTSSFSSSSQDQDSREIEFNANAKCWGYSYNAHRFTTEAKHNFVVTILSKEEDNTYSCIRTFRSQDFQMQCKRRAKTSNNQNNNFVVKEKIVYNSVSEEIIYLQPASPLQPEVMNDYHEIFNFFNMYDNVCLISMFKFFNVHVNLPFSFAF